MKLIVFISFSFYVSFFYDSHYIDVRLLLYAGVQVNLTIKETKDEGLQVDIQDVPLTSTPVKRRRILDEPSFAASPILSPVPSNVDTTGSLYQPDELTHTLDSTLDEDDE